ncbi:MAG: hypothetical protein ABH862_04920 [Candidatus Omnitrophota bacterium]
MSIIAKALKKAQEERSKERQKDELISTNSSFTTNGTSARKSPKKKTAKQAIIISGIALGAALTAVVMFLKGPELWRDPAPKEGIIAEEPAQVMSIHGEPGKADLPVLKGIMYSVSEPQAVINGVMVSNGEIVDGFTVAEVLENTVRMVSPEGEEVELKLR